MGRIKPNQKVRVGIEVANGQILQFFCFVKEVQPDRLILMYPESKSGFAKYMPEGRELRLSIYTSGGIMLLTSIIITAPENCEFTVEYNKRTKNIQRRAYIRAKANYRLIVEQYGRTYTVLTEDISGSGVRFMSDEQLQFTNASGKLFIPEYKTGIPFTGTLFQKTYNKNNEYIFHFKDIKEEDRYKIIQTCIEIDKKN